MLVPIYREIADTPILLGASFVLEAICMVGMYILTKPLEDIEGGIPPPDLRMNGYTASELYDYYERIGDHGRNIYLDVETWDLFPYMFGYTFLLGALLVLSSRVMNRSERISLLATFTYIMDFIESIIQRYGCQIYPKQLSTSIAGLSGISCQLKWMTVGIIIAILVSDGIRMIMSTSTQSKILTSSQRLLGKFHRTTTTTEDESLYVNEPI